MVIAEVIFAKRVCVYVVPEDDAIVIVENGMNDPVEFCIDTDIFSPADGVYSVAEKTNLNRQVPSVGPSYNTMPR